MFFDRYSALCKKKNKTPTGVALELNVSRATVNYWKNGNVPKQETLVKFADYFGVTVDYLLGAEKKENPTANGDEALIFALWEGDTKDVTPEMLNKVREFARFVREEERRKSNDPNKSV